jgi:transposase
MQKGLQGLIEDERPGRPSRLTAEQIEKINLALKGKPEDVGLRDGIWDGKLLSAFIQKEFQINLGIRQCQRLFPQLRFRLRKPRPMIARANPKVQEDFK